MNNRFSPGCTSHSRSPSTSQRRSPPSSIACTMARSRCGAQRREQGVGLARVDDPRQRARGADQRHPAIRATCRQPAWHRILGDHTADDQILEQATDRGQTTLDRARRQPRLTVLDTHHRHTAARLPLGPDEPQHVRLADLHRIPADHGEKDLQVERGGQHRIRARPGGNHLQIVVEQAMPQPRDTPAPTGRTRHGTNTTTSRPQHPRPLRRIPAGTPKITHISKPVHPFGGGQLDVVDGRARGLARLMSSFLYRPDRGLGQRVVVGHRRRTRPRARVLRRGVVR